jgi:hypothetical protein
VGRSDGGELAASCLSRFKEERIGAKFVESFRLITSALGISLVIFNHRNLEGLFLHERPSCGSLTTDSQKLSMLFTTLRNPSRSTGLVM